RQILHQQFRNSLGASHVVPGVDRLIRRYVHEQGRFAPKGCQSEVANSEHIVANAFMRVELNEPHMFVRRSMKNDFRLLLSHELINEVPAGEINQQWTQDQIGIMLAQLPMDVEQTIFGFVEQQQSRWRTRGHLTGKFRTDAAPCSGNQNYFAADNLPYLFGFVRDLVSVQQVSDVELPQGSLRNLSVNQLSECRQSADRQIGLPADRENSAHLLG